MAFIVLMPAKAVALDLPAAEPINYQELLDESTRIQFAESALEAEPLLGPQGVGVARQEGASRIDPTGLEIRAYEMGPGTDPEQVSDAVGAALGDAFERVESFTWREGLMRTDLWRRDRATGADDVFVLVVDNAHPEWTEQSGPGGVPLPGDVYVIVYATEDDL